MNKLKFFLGVLAVSCVFCSCKEQEKGTASEQPKAKIYSFVLNDIDGEPVSLSRYEGKVFLIVNVASRCGFTKQYGDLEKLYERYSDRGFYVLGFPANNFRGQEPGSDAEIKEFCTINFGVTFPMFSKISVKGDDIAPLYAYLTDPNENPEFGGPITWNFNKFLIDRKGRIVGRFDSKVVPFDSELIKAIETALGSLK